MKHNKPQSQIKVLPKTPTGIQGLDEVTGGGLPKGRPTLVCGNAGCGKTLFALEFIVRGATHYNEPGIFMAFEETEKELITNVSSLEFDLDDLVAKKMIILDHVHIDKSEIEVTGKYNLEGLFIRLNNAIDSIGAKRVVLDTIESLFSGLPNSNILRAELRRLFRWLKDKGVTTIITGERGDGMLTRQGIEEYVSDCVIVLDQRVTEQTSTRRLRIVKYRGSMHGTNEYPFLIDESGVSVLPITSIGLAHTVTSERISSGIPRLDTMLGGKGYYRGSSVLVSGTAGTGKTSLAANISVATCQHGENVLYFSLEESPNQIIRNMSSIGIDLEPWVKKGSLKIQSRRATFCGLESFLAAMYKEISYFKPQLVVIDPISSFIVGTNEFEASSMLMRLIDFLKFNHITAFMISLTTNGNNLEHTETSISSMVDSWLLLRDLESGSERNRGIYILKSRGMSHSNQIREFILTDNGVELADVYIGMEGVMAGSARIAQEAKEKEEQLLHQQEIERKRFELECKHKALENQIALLQIAFETEESEVLKSIEHNKERIKCSSQDKKKMAESRKADANVKTAVTNKKK